MFQPHINKILRPIDKRRAHQSCNLTAESSCCTFHHYSRLSSQYYILRELRGILNEMCVLDRTHELRDTRQWQGWRNGLLLNSFRLSVSLATLQHNRICGVGAFPSRFHPRHRSFLFFLPSFNLSLCLWKYPVDALCSHIFLHSQKYQVLTQPISND